MYDSMVYDYYAEEIGEYGAFDDYDLDSDIPEPDTELAIDRYDTDWNVAEGIYGTIDVSVPSMWWGEPKQKHSTQRLNLATGEWETLAPSPDFQAAIDAYYGRNDPMVHAITMADWPF